MCFANPAHRRWNWGDARWNPLIRCHIRYLCPDPFRFLHSNNAIVMFWEDIFSYQSSEGSFRSLFSPLAQKKFQNQITLTILIFLKLWTFLNEEMPKPLKFFEIDILKIFRVYFKKSWTRFWVERTYRSFGEYSFSSPQHFWNFSCKQNRFFCVVVSVQSTIYECY